MSAVAGSTSGSRKFCPECGTPTAEGGRFCGGCGNALDHEDSTSVSEVPQPSPLADGGAKPSHAALLSGGLWTFADASAGRTAIWLARIGALGMLLPALYLASWCWTFRFGDRAGLAASHGESAAILLVASSPFALFLAIPLARRVARSGTPLDPSRQRRLRNGGIALHAVALALGLGYGVMHRDVSDLISIERQDEQGQEARREEARKQEALFDEIDKQFPPGTTYYERNGRTPRRGR